MLSHENLSFILYRVQFILRRVNVLKSASLCFYFSHHSSLRMFRLFYRFYGTILFSMTAASQPFPTEEAFLLYRHFPMLSSCFLKFFCVNSKFISMFQPNVRRLCYETTSLVYALSANLSTLF